MEQMKKEDYKNTENLVREAFWNVYKPGADEHYFVHEMRNHPDFLPELAFVLEKDGKVVGEPVWFEKTASNWKFSVKNLNGSYEAKFYAVNADNEVHTITVE